MLHCFQCAADLPDNMLYCLQCGSPLDEQPTVIRKRPSVRRVRGGVIAFAGIVCVSAFAVVFMFMIASYRQPEPPPSPAMNTAANPYANANANTKEMYAPYQNGKPLRAVCNNGEASYWQGDRFATCLLKGGVREWKR